MLTMEEPSKPAETGLLREDGGSGAHAEDTATLSGEHGLAEQTLNQQLQQQVAQLHEALRRQESRWAAAQRHLQSQIDALVQQNLELQDRLTAPRPLWEADAALGARRKLDTLATHQSSQSLQEQSGQKSLEQAAGVARLQDGPAAQGKGARPLPCKGPEGGLLTRERAGRSVCSPPGTARPQNPPGEPGPSHVDTQTEQGDQEEGTRSPASKGDTMGFEDLTSPSHQGVYEKEAPLLTHSLEENVAEALGKGHEAVTFSKGTGKNRGAGQKTTILRFLNGDVKKVPPDQRVVYGFADACTTRTTHPSGLAIVRFPKQTEKYHPDGSKEIVHPDGTVRRLSGGREETVFPDGTVVTVERNGDRTIVFSNGQREIQTAGFTQREYPDGTVRTVYCTGSQETRSASGTVRIRLPRH